MERNSQNSIRMLHRAASHDLYVLLVAQLQKDFERANVGATFSDTLSPESLYSMLREKMYLLIMEHFSQYLNLLYVVDVPEKAILDLGRTDAVDAAEEVSYLVLEREWQKVRMKSGRD